MDKSNMEPVIKQDSLNKRYATKLVVNIVNIPLMFVVQAIIPRALGPLLYGHFSFLTNFFQQIFNFTDSGTSLAFYTKLSKNLKNKGIIKFYLNFTLIVVAVIFLITSIFLFFGNIKENLWPSQKTQYILMALIWAILMWYIQVVNRIVDAYGLTVQGEKIRLIQNFLSVILLSILYFLNFVNLTTFFLYQYLIFVFILVSWITLLKKQDIDIFTIEKLSKNQRNNYIKEFWNYSNPLILYTAISMLAGMFDYWLLQKYAGSVQQGYFGLSYKLAGISFLFASAMTPLITREFSLAAGSNNIEQMRNLFKKYIPLLFAIVAAISAFVCVNSPEITMIFGGDDFVKAAPAVAIMALYPAHQTYGQLSGSLFYATGKTKLYRNIGIASLTLGAILSYYLIAPSELNLGAKGIAIKMIIIQFIGVNVQLFFNTRYLRFSFLKFLIHQIIVLSSLLFISFTINIFTNTLTEHQWFNFFANLILYLITVFLFFFFVPFNFMMTRKESQIIKDKIILFLTSKKM